MARKILNILTTVLLVLLILIVVVAVISRAAGKTPTVFGYCIFRVSSESMEPTLKVGEVILVHSSAPEDIQIGDIITYKGEEDEFAGKMITHRVIKAFKNPDGGYVFQTKGDRDGALPDPEITFDRVEGKYVRSLPLLDKLYGFFLSPYGIITFIVLIIALFGYEIITLILSYKADEELLGSEEKESGSKKKRKREKKI